MQKQQQFSPFKVERRASVMVEAVYIEPEEVVNLCMVYDGEIAIGDKVSVTRDSKVLGYTTVMRIIGPDTTPTSEDCGIVVSEFDLEKGDILELAK